MKIERRDVGDVVILDIEGPMITGEGDELLKESVQELVVQGHRKVVLNMAKVSHSDSMGLGEIIRAYSALSKLNGDMKLLSVTFRLEELFEIMELDGVIGTYENEDEAVASFTD